MCKAVQMTVIRGLCWKVKYETQRSLYCFSKPYVYQNCCSSGKLQLHKGGEGEDTNAKPVAFKESAVRTAVKIQPDMPVISIRRPGFDSKLHFRF